MLLEGVSWVLALAADERTSSKLPLLSDAPTFVCKNNIKSEQIPKLDWSQITASSASDSTSKYGKQKKNQYNLMSLRTATGSVWPQTSNYTQIPVFSLLQPHFLGFFNIQLELPLQPPTFSTFLKKLFKKKKSCIGVFHGYSTTKTVLFSIEFWPIQQV